MITLQRELRPLLSSAAILFLIAAPPVAAQSERLGFAPATFAAEGGRTADADTATLVVPANRAARGSGGVVTIPVVRFRSTAAQPGAPVVYLSGGTGSGIAAARGPRFAMFMALRELGDVITLDLRGAGHSTPRVDCGAGPALDVTQPIGYDSLAAVLNRHAVRCADSLRRAGVDLAGHNVREVVEDVESLRRALNVPRIRLVGISTGSQLALEYLRRHESRVDAVVAAGVQAPDQNVHLPADQEGVVRAFAARLQARDTTSADLITSLRHLIDTLAAQPRMVPVTTPRGDTLRVSLGAFDVQLLVSATLGDRRQMSMMASMVAQALRGNFGPFAMMKLGAARQGITSPFEALMDCQSGAPAERAALAAAQSRTALLGRATLDFPEACAGWGVSPLDRSYRQPVRSSGHVLLISGTLDGRTPPRNGDEALAHLRNGVHLVIAGASHGDDLFLGSPEIVATMLRFFRSESLGSPRRIEIALR